MRGAGHDMDCRAWPNGDGQWWIYDELAASADRRAEIAADCERVRSARWWLGGLVAALVAGGSYEAVAAALGDSRFTLSAALELTLVAFGASVLVTLGPATAAPVAKPSPLHRLSRCRFSRKDGMN
jgi:hypothetical protein